MEDMEAKTTEGARIELTDVSGTRKRLEVEVDQATVETVTREVLKRYAREARIPGFRKGKAPLAVIRKRFADEVKEDVRDRLLSRFWHEGTHGRGVSPLGEPVVEEVHDHPGEPFRFKASFEVLPDFRPKDYRGVEVRRQKVEVTDNDVDEALEELRQSRSTLAVQEGREAVTGDYLLADVEGLPERGESFGKEKALLEVGATENLPDFNEALLGARAGADLEFSVRYPKEYPSEKLADQTVAYKLHVHEVKVREVPDLDDEFAKDLGDFENLAALREKAREDLTARREFEAKRQLEQAVVDKVLLENPLPLPDVLVDEEIRHRLEDTVRAMMMRGMDPRQLDLDWKQLREKQEEPARKSVHARLVLDAIAREERLEVGEQEVEERLRLEAARVGETVEKLKARLREGQGRKALENQMLREKSLDLLTSVANIQTEES